MVCATECGIIVDKELRRLIPPLTDEEGLAFARKELGFEGFSDDGMRHAMLIPTPLSPHYWIWVARDLRLRIEEYSPEATACARIPWGRLQGIAFEATPWEPTWKYPPPPTTRSEDVPPPHLYVIQADIGGPVKIGMSRNPASRAEQLQPGNPFLLQVIRVFHQRGQDEKAVHEALRDHQLQGEWFDESAVEIVDELMAGGARHG